MAMFGRIVLWLDHAGLIAAGGASCAIVVIVTTGVFMRALGRPLLFADEYSGFLMAALVFLALPAVTRERTHIFAEFPAMLAPPRVQMMLRILSDLLLLGYTAVLLWLAVRLTAGSYADGLRSQGLMSTPLFIPQTAMVVGLALMVLRGGLNLGFSIRNAARR